MIDMQAPCYHCQVRSDCCHVGCPAYQSYVRKCRNSTKNMRWRYTQRRPS